MVITSLLIAVDFFALAVCLVPPNFSLPLNVSTTNHVELLVNNLRFNIESIGSKTQPALNGLQVAGTWDPNHFASEEDIAKYHNKGRWIGCLLDMTDEEAGKALPDPLARTPKSAGSPWTGTLEKELSTWGWRDAEFEQTGCDMDTGSENIGTALKALGLSAKSKESGGDNVCHLLNHFDDDAVDDKGKQLDTEDQHYIVDGKQYTCTGSSYTFGINHIGGAIIGMVFENPTYAAQDQWTKRKPTTADMPHLQRASDIMFAYWLRDNPHPKNLRYYIVNDVQNDATSSLIASILHSRKITHVPLWPGVKLGMWEGEGEMLLGSPLGSTLAHMLFQHKKELGVKHVTEVTVFRTEDREDPPLPYPVVELVYRIEDVPEPEGEMPDIQGFEGVNVKVRQVVRRAERGGMLRVQEFKVRRDGQVQVF